jgi:hypothetical protein
LDARVEQYQLLPTILPAKVQTVDGEVRAVGCADLNHRSRQLESSGHRPAQPRGRDRLDPDIDGDLASGEWLAAGELRTMEYTARAPLRGRVRPHQPLT